MGFLGGFGAFQDSLDTNTILKKRTVEFTLDFTPGVLLTHYFLLYGRVGITTNRTTLQSSSQFDYSDNITFFGAHTNAANLLLSKNKNNPGLRLGAGLAHYINDNLVLNINYIYTYYGKILASSATTVPALTPATDGANAVPDGLKSTSSIKLKSQMFMLGINYYFSNQYHDLETNSKILSNCDYSGFFGGISAGLSELNGKFQTYTSLTYVDPNNSDATINRTLSHKINAKNNTPDFGISIGYSQLLCEKFYLGGELGGRYRTRNNTTSNTSSTSQLLTVVRFSDTIDTQLKGKISKYEVTLDLTPGIKFCNNLLLYGRVGIAINRIKFGTATNANIRGAAGFSTTSTAIQTVDKTRPGLRLGLGMGQYVSENVVLNANYIYTKYIKINNAMSADTDTTRSTHPAPVTSKGLLGNNHFKLSSHAIMLGLNYYFGN